MRSIIAILFVLLLGIKNFGQTNPKLLTEIDSFQNLYQSTNNDSLKITYMTKIGHRYRFVNMDSSKHYLWKALANYREKKFKSRLQAFAYNVIADIYRLEPNIDSARYYYEEAIITFRNEKTIRPFLAIAPPFGKFLIENNDPERGIKLFDDAIVLAKEHKLFHDLSFLYMYLGNVFYKIQKDNKKAIEFYEKAMESSILIDDKINYNRISTTTNLALSDIYLDEKKYEKVISHAKKAVKFGQKSNLFQKVLSAYNNLCKSYIATNRNTKAEGYNLKAIALSKKVKNIYANIETKILSQKLNLVFKKYSECVEKGNEIFNTHKTILTNKLKSQIYNNLCDCYSHLGNSQQSIATKDSLIFYNNLIIQGNHKKLLTKLYTELEAKEQKSENELLKTKQEAVEKKLKFQRFAAIGLFIALSFAIALKVTLYRSYLQKRRYNDQLEITVDERTQELQAVNKELEQTNYELRTLTYIASHDIKEPIRNIGNYAGLIKRKLPKELKEDFSHYFDVIKNNSTRLYTLMEDFTNYITFSKDIKISKENIALDEIFDDIKNNFIANESPNTQVDNLGLPAIRCNYSVIYAILKNLIDNGLKHNESSQPRVIVSSVKSESEIKIIVEDNGVGIAPEYHDKIFEMFKRLDDRAQNSGSGMGLSIVQLLVEKLNGKIELESTPTEGSQFIVTLPIITAPPKKEEVLANLN